MKQKNVIDNMPRGIHIFAKDVFVPCPEFMGKVMNLKIRKSVINQWNFPYLEHTGKETVPVKIIGDYKKFLIGEIVPGFLPREGGKNWITIPKISLKTGEMELKELT